MEKNHLIYETTLAYMYMSLGDGSKCVINQQIHIILYCDLINYYVVKHCLTWTPFMLPDIWYYLIYLRIYSPFSSFNYNSHSLPVAGIHLFKSHYYNLYGQYSARYNMLSLIENGCIYLILKLVLCTLYKCYDKIKKNIRSITVITYSFARALKQ